MEPLIAFTATTLALRSLGWIWVAYFDAWRPALRGGLSALFLTTGVVHFTPGFREAMVEMVPPALPWPEALVAITGALELAGAVGLWVRPFRRAAAVCLALLMAAMFPANVYAALNDVDFNGSAATPLLPRTLMQILWIGAALVVASEPSQSKRRDTRESRIAPEGRPAAEPSAPGRRR